MSTIEIESLVETWRGEFGSAPIDAGDIVANPRMLAAFAAALPWPVEHLNARIVGRHIRRLMGDDVMKLPTARSFAQRWSLKSS
jgi:hypothetical protein